MGGKRLTCLILGAVFLIEALYGVWSIRVWRLLSQLGTLPGEHLDIHVSAWHPYVVWTKVGTWMAAGKDMDLAAVMGQLVSIMWTMVIGGGVCALLFFILAYRAKPKEA